MAFDLIVFREQSNDGQFDFFPENLQGEQGAQKTGKDQLQDIAAGRGVDIGVGIIVGNQHQHQGKYDYFYMLHGKNHRKIKI
jgi:hypothetical protein